jgi:hypothetical protein
MTFLAPLFLLGALAVALPIIFHLIRRTSREKVRFSSLMFLTPSPPRITRRSRLEHILLLLLRCAVICLLALAFARPFLRRPLFDPPADVTPVKTVLLVDTSASMRRENLWADAVARVDAILKSVSPGGQVALLAFDQSVRTVVSFEEWNRAPVDGRVTLLRERLSAVQPTWKAGHLDTALIRATEELQAQEPQRLGPQQIVVISDLQEGNHLDRLQSYEWPKNIEVRIETVKARQIGNAGLHLVSDRDATTLALPAVRARVTNSRDSKVDQFTIRWAGTRAGDSNTSVTVYVPAGQTRVFQAPALPSNAPASTLLLSGDPISFDNQAYRAEPLRTDVRVLFLGSEADNDPTRALYYVKRALQQTQRQRLELLGGDAAAQQLAAVNTNDPGLAILAIVTAELNERVAQRLGGWVRSGKTALFVLGSPVMAATLQQVIGGTDGIPCEEASGSTYAMLKQIEFEHPIFTPFADPRYSDFTKIHFWKHRRFNASSLPDSRVLATFDDDAPALLEMSLGNGKLLVLSSGWAPAESQLALSSKFVPLLYSILEYAGAPRTGSAQFLVGNPVPLPSARLPEQRTCTIRTPDGRTIEAPPGESFSGTDVPGVYFIIGLSVTQQFAVNLAESESKTAPLPPEELQRLGVPLGNSYKPKAERVEQKRRQLHHLELENRQKLWRWLIIAVLVLLVVETWFAARLTRRVSMGEIPV